MKSGSDLNNMINIGPMEKSGSDINIIPGQSCEAYVVVEGEEKENLEEGST